MIIGWSCYKIVISLILLLLICCGCGKESWIPTEKEATESVKTYLSQKYSKNFEVTSIELIPARADPWQYDVHVSDGSNTSYVKYNTHFIWENVERRDWTKEAYDFYSNLLSRYPQDGYLEDVSFFEDKNAPSKVGMTFNEYFDELTTPKKCDGGESVGIPLTSLNYALFVEKVDNMKTYNNVILDLDNYLNLKPKSGYYFSIHFRLVNKNEKEEYIKKVKEYNELQNKHFREKTIDDQAYSAMFKSYNEWFDGHILARGYVEHKDWDSELKKNKTTIRWRND